MNPDVPISQLQPIISSSGTEQRSQPCDLREVTTTPRSLSVLVCKTGRAFRVARLKQHSGWASCPQTLAEFMHQALSMPGQEEVVQSHVVSVFLDLVLSI